MSSSNLQETPIIYANRNEYSVQLALIEGSLEAIKDIYGVVYITSPVGSVNSKGLPFPEYYEDNQFNKEYATPLMNGDGMTIKIDFNVEGQVLCQTKLMKTPCYFADEATGRDGALANDSTYRFYPFKNMGIARLSPMLGGRNELNTAFVPFQFKSDPYPRILATYDVGRPFEFSPSSMELITPIGKNTEWIPATPPLLKMPFPLIQTTAHPVFDPLTEELFTVNYTKSIQTMLSSIHVLLMMMKGEDRLEKELEDLADSYHQHHDKEKSIQDLNTFFKKPKSTFSIGELVEEGIEEGLEDMTGMEDAVYLMLWNGKEGDLKKWNVVDENGKNIVIEQCMHQMGITKDYIILADSSFKFTIDILINNPFPHNPKIDAFIREVTSAPMLPYLTLYLIKRTDLDSGRATVLAKKLKSPIPLEAVHFSADYANPNGEITVYAAHNSAACMAEWLRAYDVLGIDPTQKVDKDWLSMFAMGAMDIGRIGKFVINAESAEIIDGKSKIIHETGNIQDASNIGNHTWELGLYTYRDIIVADKMVDQIKNMYFVCFGLDPRTLTHFIVNLYKDYPNRIIPVEEILKYSKEGLPTVINRLNTLTMEMEDFYQLPMDYNVRSIQFVPKKNVQDSSVDLSKEGYIMCTLINRVKDSNPALYTREIWFFDAADLKKGPLCKLSHPELNFGFTLHTAWLAEAVNGDAPAYKINIEEDYNSLINKFWWPPKRKHMKALFENYVYPHFR